MVGSNSATCLNTKRQSFPWIRNYKGKVEKAYFCKLQSSFGRRRYLRRGSKTSKMLQAAMNELDESVHSCTTTPSSSSEFSLHSGSPDFTLNFVRETNSIAEESPGKNTILSSSMERQRHSVSMLTSALAITTIIDDIE